MQEKFDKLGKYEIKLVQWNDKRGHRRLGLDRDGEDLFYLVEKPTIEECLDCAIRYVETGLMCGEEEE